MTTTRTLTDQQRADIAAARNRLNDAAERHHHGEYETAAARLDRVLATVCRHEPVFRHLPTDRRTRRPKVFCYACGVGWFGDYPARLGDGTGRGEEGPP